ncbi:unnamed protein product [Larinioides sclopetarius]|uniref:Uncharacterized protein n=1 Tax=Larinioides sclopetarius TaxID=280406 RepID=A0AAV2BEK2_9ARAC
MGLRKCKTTARISNISCLKSYSFDTDRKRRNTTRVLEHSGKKSKSRLKIRGYLGEDDIELFLPPLEEMPEAKGYEEAIFEL